jgi:hypothetical protein
MLHSSTERFSHRLYHFAMSVYFSAIKCELAILTEWWQQRIAWWELLNAARDVIRSRQPAKISGNSSCHRQLLFLFKKNNERKSSISNTTYSACIYWSACLHLQIFTNKHRYISSNPNDISRYFPLIGDEIVDGEGLNYPGNIFSFFF